MNMGCDEVREALQRALDGAADGRGTREHLVACAACRSYAVALRQVGKALAADAVRPMAMIDMTARLGLAAPAAPVQRRRTAWQGALAATAAVAAAVLVGVGPWTNVPGPGGVSPSVAVSTTVVDPDDGVLLLAFFGTDEDEVELELL